MDKPFVLLADDNEATCTLIRAILVRDFEVDVVRDGADAIEMLRGRQYAAILLDLFMPVTDGYSVLEFVRSERPDLLPNVVVITAAVSAKEMERLREYAICEVIAKPFEVDLLLATVKRCADRDAPRTRGPLLSSGVIMLLADLLRA